MIQVYTGSGKGKTTAAIGLAIRAVGAGKRVYMMQFMKGKAYSEQAPLSRMSPAVTLKSTGKPFFVAKEGMLTPEEIQRWGDDVVVFSPGNPPADYAKLLQSGFSEAEEACLSGDYNLVILDELNVALFFGLIDPDPVKKLLDRVPDSTEIVLTGRNAPKWLTERADLVTDMREVKHYYSKGLQARRGIEN